MVNDFEQDAKNGTGQNDEDDVDIKNAVCKEGKHHNPDVNRLMLPDDVTAQAKNNVQNDRSNTGLHTFQCKGNIEICSKSRIKKEMPERIAMGGMMVPMTDVTIPINPPTRQPTRIAALTAIAPGLD